ncbi:MAG: Ig-like domain-containing protein [Tannerellaceae bacterium]|nr:Ig-like domain-containing protein [Tannerellaceae bacterium]
MNKFLLKGVAALLCLTTAFFTVPCSDDDDDTNQSVSVTGVTLDRGAFSIAPGNSYQLTATVQPTSATNQSVSWSSSDESVATVTNDGTVTAVEEGTATITVTTAEGGYTATCTVTVEDGAEIPGETIYIDEAITADVTFEEKNIYILRGFIYVREGATLTIEPETIIKGETASMGALIVERGAKIIAERTKEKPIVFTSEKAKGERSFGDWGGLILCGKAPINASDGEAQIEGGPTSFYGGNDPDDSSGIVKYVRIEFAGYPFQPDKEINGLTCGGVGRGTTIEYVQVSYCGDDSYEWFGGNVNCKYLIAYKGWDDDFDTDNGYSGKLQFLLSIRDPQHADTSKSNGFESDNDGEGSGNTPLTNPVFSNVTIIGPFYGESYGKADSEILYTTEDAANGAKGGQFQAAMHICRNSSLEVYNSVFTGWPYGLYFQNANEGVMIKNVILAGMWKDFYDETSEEYFTTSSLNNTIYASTNEVIATNADYSSVVTSAVAGADFSDASLNDSFFTKVDYKGAFDGTNDWTEGWANFDPQNTDY